MITKFIFEVRELKLYYYDKENKLIEVAKKNLKNGKYRGEFYYIVNDMAWLGFSIRYLETTGETWLRLWYRVKINDDETINYKKKVLKIDNRVEIEFKKEDEYIKVYDSHLLKEKDKAKGHKWMNKQEYLKLVGNGDTKNKRIFR